MKSFIILIVAACLACPVWVFAGNHSVRGHMRDSDGDGYKETYVRPHVRTNSNDTPRDNYNYPGNYNPNTGRYSK